MPVNFPSDKPSNLMSASFCMPLFRPITTLIACICLFTMQSGRITAQSTTDTNTGSDTHTGAVSDVHSGTKTDRGTGTDSDTNSDTDSSIQQNSKKKSKVKPPPPDPGNPLVKNSDNGSGNAPGKYNPDGTLKQPRNTKKTDYGDYNPITNDNRLIKPAKKLPIYKYDDFAPARQLIEARRAYLMNFYPPTFSNRNSSNRGMRGNGPDSISNGYRVPAGRGSSTAPYDSLTGVGSTARVGKPARSDDQDSSTSDDSTQNRTGRRTNGDTADDDTASSTMPRRIRTTDDGSSDSSDDNSTTRSNPVRRNTTKSDSQDDSDTTSDSSSDTSDTTSSRGQQKTTRRNTDSTGRADDTTDQGTDQNTGASSANRRNRNQNQNDSNQGILTTRPNMGSDATPESLSAYQNVADPLTQLVRNVSATVPTTYQLSGGDQVVIRYSNPAMDQKTLTKTVDPQGSIDLGDMGHVSVVGMTLKQAETAIQQHLKRFYKKPEVYLSLKELRTITVYVGGKVFAPGSYTVPAVTTAANLLYAAGGPTENGSFRDIEVHRFGRTLKLDLYKANSIDTSNHSTSFADSIDSANDIPLQAGDRLVVPGCRIRVSLAGQVREEAQFELNDGETLADVLTFAGGVKASGASHSIQVYTLEPGAARIIKTVDLADKSKVKSLPLYDGDIVNVNAVRPTIENMVSIRGAVGQPSDYALTPNMRVADLIRAAGNTQSEAFLGQAALYRWNSDNTTTLISVNLEKALAGDPQANLPLATWDRLEVYTRQDVAFAGTRKITVKGAVQYEGTYEHAENMHISDLLYKAGGVLPNAEEIIVEHQHGDGTKKYEYVNVADITHGNKSKNILIEDNDIVGVYRNDQAGFTPVHTVLIKGEVLTEGVYDRGEGMRLTDLLKLAGGFKPDAGASVTVAHARKPIDNGDGPVQAVSIQFDSQHRCAPQDDIRLEDGDVVAVQGTGGFMDKPPVVTISGSVNHPGPYFVTDKKMRLSDLIAKAGGLRPEAFPEGAAFMRDPKNLSSESQKEIARYVRDLSNLTNASEYERISAEKDLERIKATSTATGSGSILGGDTGTASSPIGVAVANQLSKRSLVSKGRPLGEDDLEPNGNIAINLPEALKKPKGQDDIILLDGDKIVIPETPTTVQVVGAVINQRAVLYQSGQLLTHYIDEAGGFAPDADKEHILVIHAGGGLAPGKNIKFLRPGDVVFVPTKVMSAKIAGKSNNWDSFFKSLTSGAILYRLTTGVFGL